MARKKSWGDYYAGAGSVDYFLEHLAIHKDFIKEILSCKPSSVLEAGCGSAIMSVFFSMSGVSVTACDRDEEVLRKAREISDSWRAKVNFVKQDLLDLSFKKNEFDISFSQGVLEHMSDAQIQKVSASLLEVSSAFIFSVPSFYYKHKDFGDERLLKKEDWERILASVGRLTMSYYFEQRVKRNFLIKRPLMLMGVLSR